MSGEHMAAELVIVGAGPAGIGAALAARAAGLSVIVVDDQIEPGGQIWRSAGSAAPDHAARLGKEYEFGRVQVQNFMACGATYLREHTVWHIEIVAGRPTLQCAGPDGGGAITAGQLLLATGALERPVPIPGWTMPGVMTAGGLQILLKSARLSADNAVLAGAGPLLWLLAAQMVEAGNPPRAVVESVSGGAYLRSLRYLPGALRHPGPLAKGLGLIARVQRAGVAVHRFARALRVEGDGRVQALGFRDWRGRAQRIDAGIIGLHAGVIPNQQASRLLRLPHQWDREQHAFCPERDAGLKVHERIFLAGDGARIGGAEVAWLEGQLVGRLAAGSDDPALRARVATRRATRPFLDSLYRPGEALRRPADMTTLCRCEEVTAGRVRQAVRDGASGPNQVKFLLRAGMGPCQGRVCGLAVSEVISEGLGQDMDSTGYFRIRPPLKPVPLGVIARSGAMTDKDRSGNVQ